MLLGRSGRSVLRRQPCAAAGQPGSEEGRGDLHPRPQRGRQDQPVAGDLRAQPDPLRPYPLGGPRPDRASRRTTAPAPGWRWCRRAARSSRACRCWRTCAPASPPAAQPAPHPGRDLHAVPGAEGHAGPARRRFVGRPAAAIGDRPRAGDAAAPVDPRRADRGHPALDHQGDRPGHRATGGARRHGDPAGRAVFRVRPRPRLRPTS